MKRIKLLLLILAVQFLILPAVYASDFDWARNFNVQAEADPTGLRARLEARFKIGPFEIDAVLDSADKPSDAYVLFRLGEISGQPLNYVVHQYKSNKGKGWGRLAKSLGIKPGSRAFKVLKNSQDLYRENAKGKGKGKSKGKGNAKWGGKG
jgi:hypothetical protein